VGFWAFLFSPKYRTRVLDSWRQAGLGMPSLKVLEALIATMVGVGLPLLVIWLISREFLE
jgi:hypothetical protein